MNKKPVLGALPSPYDYRDFPVKLIVEEVSLPESVRLDDEIMKVLNQGFCGTCVGKGSNHILSAGHEENLSSLYIYARCKALDGMPNQEGTYPRIALKVMQQEGSCPEHMLPYEELKDCIVLPQVSNHMLSEAMKYRIKEYARLWSIDDIKQALNAGLMVGVTYRVSNNWYNYRDGIMDLLDIYSFQGLHYVVLCGYDDTIGAFRGINSWGEAWGEGGYFWTSYQSISEIVEVWAVKIKKKEYDKMTDKPWYSEKWWSMLFAVLIPVLNLVFNWGIEAGYVFALIVPFLAMFFGEKWKEKEIELAKIRAKTEKDIAKLKLKQ